MAVPAYVNVALLLYMSTFQSRCSEEADELEQSFSIVYSSARNPAMTCRRRGTVRSEDVGASTSGQGGKKTAK